MKIIKAKRLELVDDKSSKFYELEIQDLENGHFALVASYGKIGALIPKMESKAFNQNPTLLEPQFEKTIADKLKKGYKEVAIQQSSPLVKNEITFEAILKAQARALKHPQISEIQETVSSINGMDLFVIDPDSTEEEFKKILGLKGPVIALTPDELLGNGTVCGSVGNQCFTSKVVDFLKSNGVEEVFTSLMYDDQIKSYSITGASIKLAQNKAKQLSNLIGMGDGSWRDDLGHARGWSSFESE